MNYSKRTYTVALILGMMVSCSGGGDSGGEEEILDPTKAALIFPNNNEECTAGVVISNTQAKLTFDWNKADNTTAYTLFLKNLETNATQDFDSNSDDLEITIERGTPYSWYVVSKSNKTTNTATSDTWKFYLAGIGVENYAPFPAELKSPTNGAAISAATANLEWTGNDVDNDIKEYDVYLDTNTSPTTKVSTTTVQKLDSHSVSASTTYYWKVVTRDNHGNTSTSEVYSFSTN
ncbi:hypothetical protein [Algibacter sp. 2305UL17-15]|uniref:hypothetical protein n=1 Tax=Algibacter sp. 2305UL17-15 TaxID=3231268 RepID=UPI0034580703